METENNELFFKNLTLKKYYFVFAPNNYNKRKEIIYLNRSFNNKIRMDSLYLQLLKIKTTDEIMDYIINNDICDYAKNLIPKNSGYLTKPNTCYIKNPSKLVGNDIAELHTCKRFIQNNNVYTCIMFKPSIYLKMYSKLLKKHIINMVITYLKTTYPDQIDNLNIMQNNKFIEIYWKYESDPNIDIEKLDVKFNNFHNVINNNKTECLKIVLFKFYINDINPYIRLGHKIDNKLLDNIINDEKTVKMFNKSSISLLNGTFGFL